MTWEQILKLVNEFRKEAFEELKEAKEQRELLIEVLTPKIQTLLAMGIPYELIVSSFVSTSSDELGTSPTLREIVMYVCGHTRY